MGIYFTQVTPICWRLSALGEEDPALQNHDWRARDDAGAAPSAGCCY